MHRFTPIAAALLACGALAALTAGAASSRVTARPAATSPTVKLVSTAKGKILVNGAGMTVYMFSKDHGSVDSCAKISGCLAQWPALTASGKPSGGPGVNASKLGTIGLGAGKKQVTYYGHPLYTFKGDSSKADVSYLGVSGFGGTWSGLSASGARVK